MNNKDISQYVSEATRIQGSIAERERSANLKKQEFRRLVEDLPSDLCEKLERQYGISIKKFTEVNLDDLELEEIRQLQEEATLAIERIKGVLGQMFEKFRGD